MREMNDFVGAVERDVESICCRGNCYDNHVISVDDINKALLKVKSGKSDSLPGLTSDHFKNAPAELGVHLSLLLTSMLRHV